MPTSPAAMAFTALVASTGFLFMIWHTWHYDRWRCLLYSRNDWFRAVMCHILLGAIACLTVYTWIAVHVLYDEYWIYLPSAQQTIIAPYQLWSQGHQDLWRISLYFMTAGWGFLLATHLEEFLYWGYLIKSINTPGGPRTTWLRSGFFKVWVGLWISCFALLIGAVHIETTNLDMMRAYLFVVGGSLSVLLAVASIVLCFIFPSFLRTVKRQGANFEVVDRLHFFAEMNQIRTVCRLAYSIGILILSVDGLTKNKTINKSMFWHDILYVTSQLSLFAATCLSIVVLLPRNMTSESLPPHPTDQTFHPMVPYKRPAPEGYSGKQFYELGERLNVGPDAMLGTAGGLMVPHTPDIGFEMSITPPSINKTAETTTTRDEAPFTEVADKTKKARLSEMPILPSVVQKFRSPFETGEPKSKGPTQVFVTTSHTVVEE